MLISVVTAVILLCLPAAVLEFSEPNFGAMTMMRRIVGGEAILLAVVCSLLLDAHERGRLGASTFKALNLAAAASTALVRISSVHTIEVTHKHCRTYGTSGTHHEVQLS